MKVQLTIYNNGKEYFSRVISTPCVIGRGKQSGVAILHPLISRQHCEIYEENGQIYVRDLGSLNGTFFQGARIGRGTLIAFGSSFMIGKLSFKIDLSDDSSESVVIPTEPLVDSGETREELRQRGLKGLDEFEQKSKELGLTPETEVDDESDEIKLASEYETHATSPRNSAQTTRSDVESERRQEVEEEDVSDDDDLIDLEKFLKGEL